MIRRRAYSAPKTSMEGGRMNAELFWELFLDTGAPEAYLLYKSALHQAEPVSA